MELSKKMDIGLLLAWIIIAVYLLSVFLPFFFTFLTSIKPTNEITKSPVTYRFTATFQPYFEVLFERAYGRYLLNTIMISLATVALCVLFGMPAAYGLARFTFPMKKSIMFTTISIRLIPPISLIVPFFLFISFLRLIDSIASLILVNFMLNLPFYIWITWGFFKEIPWDLEEAALLDGCSRLESLVKVILPIAAPGIGAAAIVSFLFTWNEYLFALTFSQSVLSKTISVGISDFIGDIFVRWNLISAAGIITTIPAIIFIFVFQKYIVQGLSAGSVKG